MFAKQIVRPSLVALILGAGLALPAAAQPQMQNRRAGPVSADNLWNWNYNDLYRTGWSAERLMDKAEVIGAKGDDIGSIENIIVSQRGQILGIIAEVGGFWDIGDTHVFVPWDQVRISQTLDRVVVPVTEDNVDDYDYSPVDVLTHFRANRTRVVDDDLGTGPVIWKATDLIDDYAYLNNRRAFGYIKDLIFSPGGRVQAVVVNAGGAWGGGYRAFPFTGYAAGGNAGSSDYYLGYGENEVANLERFDFDRLPGRVMVNNQIGSGSNAQAQNNRTSVTGAVPTQWTFKDIDNDGNLELTDREFSRVGNNIYSRWDVNRDNRLDKNEFYTGLYKVLDADRDNRISQDEFNRGWRSWGIMGQQVSYGTLDVNGDGVLDWNEFGNGFDRLGYYDRWDSDRNGEIAQNEFNTGMYDVWDANSDDVLARNEFDDAAGLNWF